MTDQKIVECLTTEFSAFYQISPRHIEKAFQLAKEELGDSLNAYAAVQSVLVRMFRDNSKEVWKISKQTEKAMGEILGK